MGAPDPVSQIKDGWEAAQSLLDLSRGIGGVQRIDRRIDALAEEWRASGRNANVGKRIAKEVAALEESLRETADLSHRGSLVDVAASAKDATGMAIKLTHAGYATTLLQKILMLRLSGVLPEGGGWTWKARRRALERTKGWLLGLDMLALSVIRRNREGERRMEAQADALRAAGAESDFQDPVLAAEFDDEWAEAEALHDRHRAWRRGAERDLEWIRAGLRQVEAAILLGDAKHPEEAPKGAAVAADRLKEIEAQVEELMRKRVLKH